MAALVLSLLLIFQPGAQRQASGVISGRVEAAENRSAEGVRVFAAVADAAKPSGSMTIAGITQADRDGRFRFGSLAPGRYIVMAGILETPTYYPGVITPEEAIAITVDPGKTVSGIDFTTLVQSVGVTVSGRLTPMPAHIPAGGLRIQLAQTGGGLGGTFGLAAASGFDRGVADVRSDGSFQFTRVTPGTYRFNVTPALGVTNPISAEVGNADMFLEIPGPVVLVGRVRVEGGQRPAIQIPQVSSGIRNLPALVAVRTRRLDAEGQSPVAWVSEQAGSGGTREGVFFLNSLPPGEYEIAPTLAMGYTLQSMTLGNVDLMRSPLKVSVGGLPRNEELRIVLAAASPGRGVTVRGALAGMPPAQTANTSTKMIRMESVDPVSSRFNPAPVYVGQEPVRDNDTFEIRQVPRGEYRVTCVACPSGVKEFVTVANRAIAVELRPVPRVDQTRQVPLIPVTGHSVSGWVDYAGDHELRPRTVGLFGTANRVFSAEIGSGGTFIFPAVPPGAYELAPLPLNVASELRKLDVGSGDIRDIRVEAPRVTRVRGRVLGGAAAASPPAPAAMKVGLQSAKGIVWMTTQPDGSFSGEIPFGEYRPVVEGLPQALTVASIRYGELDLLRSPFRIDALLREEMRIALTPAR